MVFYCPPNSDLYRPVVQQRVTFPRVSPKQHRLFCGYPVNCLSASPNGSTVYQISPVYYFCLSVLLGLRGSWRHNPAGIKAVVGVTTAFASAAAEWLLVFFRSQKETLNSRGSCCRHPPLHLCILLHCRDWCFPPSPQLLGSCILRTHCNPTPHTACNIWTFSF